MLTWTRWILFSSLITVGIQWESRVMQLGKSCGMDSQAWPEADMFLDTQLTMYLVPFPLWTSLSSLLHSLHSWGEGWTAEISNITVIFLKGSSWNDLTLNMFKAKLCIFILSWKGSLDYAYAHMKLIVTCAMSLSSLLWHYWLEYFTHK